MAEDKVAGVVNDFIPCLFATVSSLSFSLPSSRHLTFCTSCCSCEDQEVMLKIVAISSRHRCNFGRCCAIISVDESYNHLNWSEQVGLKMFSVLATVCMLISLFGIYAVAAAATSRRRKEIAIRKVVGQKRVTISACFLRIYLTGNSHRSCGTSAGLSCYESLAARIRLQHEHPMVVVRWSDCWCYHPEICLPCLCKY